LAAWVTVTVCPLTVIVPLRWIEEVLDSAEEVRVAEPKPEVAEVMDSHAESLAADQEQPAGAAMLTEAVAAEAGIATVKGAMA
jgi:hypothetical protein